MDCWDRFCNWINWIIVVDSMPQSERSLLSDLGKIGVADIVENTK